MKPALILIALLMLCPGAAQADVFVASDPPPLRSAVCSAGAGDVVAAGTLRGPLRISVGGGGWREIGLSGCPVVAGASDGTTVIASTDPPGAGHLVVRAPSGAFGTPIALGDDTSAGAPSIAAAPGGWVAATWFADTTGLNVLIVRPDGTQTRSVLEPKTDEKGALAVTDNQTGIDASGNVTVVWTRRGQPDRVRVARGVAGGTPSAGTDPEPVADGVHGVALAVAPSGGTLVVWATEDGVHASVDGQAPQVVQAATGSAQPIATALADDGTAVVASMGRSDEIAVTERIGGAWQLARVVAQGRGSESFERYADLNKAVLATVAPGGRAAVAWATERGGSAQVLATAGQVGGAWSAEARLSAITRGASSLTLAPDAAGVARALWIDGGLGVHGATVAPAPLDAVAPVVTARLPARVPPTVDGKIVATVRVRCSEACDARLAFDPREVQDGDVDSSDIEVSAIAGAAEAGRATVLRLRASDWLEWALITHPQVRRLPLRLVVTDRAGNVVRRSVTLRVRVLKPPVRTFKVALGHRFYMETRAGDRAVARMVNDIIDTVARGHVSDATLARRYRRAIKAIARRFGTDSTYSQDVEGEIYEALWLPFARTGHDTGTILSG